MPVFEGAKGLNIHGGDFHDIVGDHHIYTLPTSPYSTGYTVPCLRNNWTGVEGVNHDNHRSQFQYVHSGYSIRTLPAANSSGYSLPRLSDSWMDESICMQDAAPPYSALVAKGESQSTATKQVLEENAPRDPSMVVPPQVVPTISGMEANPDPQVDQFNPGSGVALKAANDDHQVSQWLRRTSAEHPQQPLLERRSDVVRISTL